MVSKEDVRQFQNLSATLLTEREQIALHKCLQHFQRTRDTARLAKSTKEILDTPERSRLLAYIRAPMGKAERRRFDQYWGIHGEDNMAMSQDELVDKTEYLGRIATPPSSVTSKERYVTIYGSRGDSMGFSIRGGSEVGLGIYVSHVKPGSCAAEAGLEVGDHIIRANGVDLRCVANSGAVKVLSSSVLLNLVVIHRGKVPEWKVAKERVLWFDVAQGRVVSNPPITERRSPSSLPRVLVERKVVINLTDVADFIGLNIRGGSEYGIGVYISRVDPGGQAARVGLSPGDQVVRVNDTDYKSVTHTDAVDILRSSTHLIITIRSVGKYPVYKELCAEYTWSDGTYYNTNNISGFKAVHFPGPKNEGKRHFHRARTRESSIDQTPYGFSQTGEVQQFDDTDLDNIQAIEDLDQALEDESKLIYPEESDIKFRRHYEDSWQDIESIKENFTREEEDMTSSWINNNSSSNHRRQDSDLSDQLDYTTFLEQSALRAKLEGRKSASQEVSSVEIHHEPVIETFVEESVTDFSMSPRSPENRVAVLPSEALTSFGSPKTSKPSSPQHSHYAEMDSFSRERVTTTEGIYSQVNDLTGRPPIEVYHQTNSIDSSSASSSPIYASVHKMVKLNKNNGGRDEISEEIFKSQLERLQERQSNLSTWEISKVAGESPPSSDNVSVSSSNGSDKNKFGTWNSLKKKIGSIRIKGSAHKKRSQISRNEGESPMGSMRQKGIFERSFGSQILNTPTSERYNLMGIFEDRARLLLPEDEYKAVIRHYHTYQSDKDLERFVRLLFTILDRPEKRTLLADVRNVVSPGHLNQFDTLLETNRVQLVARQSESSQNINGEKSGNKPPKPARSKPANQMNGKTGTYDLTELSRTSPSSRTPSFTTDDFRNKQLNVVLSEDTSRPRGNPVIKEDEEVVYISKHKMILGLELTGGRNHPDDKAIKVQNVRSNGAAADDQRLQPGVEITSIDGTSVDGMTSQEAELLLQKAFSHKNPTNLGIHIRHKHLI